MTLIEYFMIQKNQGKIKKVVFNPDCAGEIVKQFLHDGAESVTIKREKC